MKIQTSDPDIETIYRRIKNGFIDLQPDFQRDLVWSVAKRQIFIDTILRGWHFPAIVLVAPPSDDRMDVLDGQQRLSTICEFIDGGFAVNGFIEPLQENLAPLHGLFYDDLPIEIKNKFNRHSLRMSELYEYKEDEPYELFFRLNQGTVLTPAEKRNTLYGPMREKVKSLVITMHSRGIDINKIGFNNNRLAYEDILSRLLYALKEGNIHKKITDQVLIDMYRSSDENTDAYKNAKLSIDRLGSIVNRKVKLSKSTLFTWLTILAYEDISSDFFYCFNEMRRMPQSRPIERLLMDIFQERSSTSVNDVLAVQLRLLSIFMIGILRGEVFESTMGQIAVEITQKFMKFDILNEELLVEIMKNSGWGKL